MELKIYGKGTYSDLLEQTAKENYVIGLSLTQDNESMIYEYTFDTSKTFKGNIEIKPLEEENPFILNDAEPEYLNRLMEAIVFKVTQINESQMAQLGLEQNPLVMATPIGLISQLQNISLQAGTLDESQEPTNETNDDMSTMLDSTAKESFNIQFSRYEGLGRSGSTVKELLRTVIANNASQTDHIINVNGMTEQDVIENYMNSIDNAKAYSITIQKNLDGYVTTVQVY